MANTTADKLARLEETKATLTAKLIEKGLDVPDNTTFLERAEMVGTIKDRGDVVNGEILPLIQAYYGAWYQKGEEIISIDTYSKSTLTDVPKFSLILFKYQSGQEFATKKQGLKDIINIYKSTNESYTLMQVIGDFYIGP